MMYMEYLQHADDKEQPYGLHMRNPGRYLNRHGSLPAQKAEDLTSLVEIDGGKLSKLRGSGMYTKQTNKPFFLRQQIPSTLSQSRELDSKENVSKLAQEEDRQLQ